MWREPAAGATRQKIPFLHPQSRAHFRTVTTDIEDKDLRDVMPEERSRGKRRVDAAHQKKKRQLEEDAMRAIASGDLHAFVRMLHEAGMKDGTPEYANALKIFHASARQR